MPRPGDTPAKQAGGPGSGTPAVSLPGAAAGAAKGSGPGASEQSDAATQAIGKGGAAKPTGTPDSDVRETDSKQPGTPGDSGKTTVISKSDLPGGKASGTAKSESAKNDEQRAKPIDPKTVVIPMVPDTSDANTTVLPVQRQGEQATEKMRLDDKSVAAQGTLRLPDPAATSAPSPADARPTVPEQPRPPQTPVAAPQRIPGAPDESAGAPKRNRRGLLIAGAAVVSIVVVIGVIIAVVGGGDNSPEAKVSAAITRYTNALETGSLTDLQAATCGAQNDFYKSMAKSPDQYASVHKLAAEQRRIPKVDGVSSVQITGDKAVAQANVYTDADPTRAARTFDLQNTADGWKVCDLPNAAQ